MYRVILVRKITDVSCSDINPYEVELEHLPRVGDFVLHTNLVLEVAAVGYPPLSPPMPRLAPDLPPMSPPAKPRLRLVVVDRK